MQKMPIERPLTSTTIRPPSETSPTLATTYFGTRAPPYRVRSQAVEVAGVLGHQLRPTRVRHGIEQDRDVVVVRMRIVGGEHQDVIGAKPFHNLCHLLGWPGVEGRHRESNSLAHHVPDR